MKSSSAAYIPPRALGAVLRERRIAFEFSFRNCMCVTAAVRLPQRMSAANVIPARDRKFNIENLRFMI